MMRWEHVSMFTLSPTLLTTFRHEYSFDNEIFWDSEVFLVICFLYNSQDEVQILGFDFRGSTKLFQ